MSETNQKPLAGVRVLDFSELAPGPFMTQCLLDLGAEIIKIERPPHGDGARLMQPGAFKVINHGKTSRFVNLKDPEEIRVMLDVVEGIDIVVEGYRPGVMDRLGLGYAQLSALNPSLVYVSISGYGNSGPLMDRPGHDINYMATSGVASLAGGLDQPPRGVALGIPVGDLCSSMYAMSAALAALLQARETGQGQFLDVSITDCLTHWMNPRIGHFQHTAKTTLAAQREDVFKKPGYDIFETRDGKYVALGALEDHFWMRVVEILQPELAGIAHTTAKQRKLRAADINAALAAVIMTLDADDVVDRLTAADAPVSLVVTATELPLTEHALARGLFGTMDDGTHYVRFPVKMAGGVGR